MQGEDGGCSKLVFGDEREPRGQMFDVMKMHEPNSLSGAQSATREEIAPLSRIWRCVLMASM